MLRKILTISTAGFALASMSGSVQAATATASASATILTPIAIATTTNMSFGDVYADNVSSGTVVLDTAGARTVTGGASTGPTAGTAAVFAVTGTPSATYAVTLPATPVTIQNVALDSMTVDTYVSNSGGALSGAGTDSFNVGATLNVGISQPTGSYTGNFDVTVNYN
ncbi:MAG: DUF4402 domain-containing protein [Gammaproteobacteria bacterium]|nr:DUF4402 domain-containing protein [Gammaproteobacteria bacterium]